MEILMSPPVMAVTGAAGVVVALVTLIVHALAFYGVDLTNEVVVAITGLLTALLGGVMVSRVREDFTALHERILADLRQGSPPPPTRPIVDDRQR
jgi:hypothetical protein